MQIAFTIVDLERSPALSRGYAAQMAKKVHNKVV